MQQIALVLAAFTALSASSLSAQEVSANSGGNSPDQTARARTVMVKGIAEPVYNVGKGITRPKVISAPSPEYSSEARKHKIGGVVTLRVVVTSEGKVTDIRVLAGRGYGLDEKAVDAARHWRFEPATIDGRPVSVEMALEMMFRLN